MTEMRIMGSREQLAIVLKAVPEHLMPDGIKGGDTKIIFDSNNADEVENARRTFNELTQKGYSAFSVKRDGEKGKRLSEFDAEEEKMILTMPLKGG